MQAVCNSTLGASSGSSNGQKRKVTSDMKGAQFVIQSNLKILTRAINALHKISDDCFIDILEDGLVFKVFNRSRSAYCGFRFGKEFFNDCDLSLFNPKNVNVCRVSMKAAQTVFKGLNSNERNSIVCEFRIDPKSDFMAVNVTMNCDVSRTIHVKLLEITGKMLRPIHDLNKFRNTTVVFASYLLPILFQMKNDIEVTLIFNENGLQLQNFQTADVTMNPHEIRDSKKVRTQAKITVDRLARHDLAFNVELSFCIREFLSIVTFADQMGYEITLHYDIPGKPIIVSISASTTYDVELLLATASNDADFEVEDRFIVEENIDEIQEDVIEKNVSKRKHSEETIVDETPKPNPNKRRPKKIKPKSPERVPLTKSQKKRMHFELVPMDILAQFDVFDKRNFVEPEESTNQTRLKPPSKGIGSTKEIGVVTIDDDENEEIPGISSQNSQHPQNLTNMNESWRQNEIKSRKRPLSQATTQRAIYEAANNTTVSMNHEEMMQEDFVGATPPPDDETMDFEPAPEENHNKSLEPPVYVNKKLRKILMGTNRSRGIVPRMSQQFAGKQVLAFDTQACNL